MSPQTRESLDKARESVEKAAYVAVGAPVAAVKALSARISDLRDAMRSSSKDMGDELTREMDEWIAEGEDVIARAMKRLRSSDVVDEVRSSAKSTKEAAEVGIEKAASGLHQGLDIIEPDEKLTTINGIGPSYAKQLREAGISGIADFMSQTATGEDISKLAKTTGFSSGTIESWREQVDLSRVNGIGGSYQMLLHRAGVWTLTQLGECDADDLAERLGSVDMPDAPEQTPSIYTVKQWVTKAKKLS